MFCGFGIKLRFCCATLITEKSNNKVSILYFIGVVFVWLKLNKKTAHCCAVFIICVEKDYFPSSAIFASTSKSSPSKTFSSVVSLPSTIVVKITVAFTFPFASFTLVTLMSLISALS